MSRERAMLPGQSGNTINEQNTQTSNSNTQRLLCPSLAVSTGLFGYLCCAVFFIESYLVKLLNKLLHLIRKIILFLSTYIIITVLCSIAEGGRLGNNYLLLRIYVCDVFGIS